MVQQISTKEKLSPGKKERYGEAPPSAQRSRKFSLKVPGLVLKRRNGPNSPVLRDSNFVTWFRSFFSDSLDFFLSLCPAPRGISLGLALSFFHPLSLLVLIFCANLNSSFSEARLRAKLATRCLEIHRRLVCFRLELVKKESAFPWLFELVHGFLCLLITL